jgi:phosphoserine phosphatase RsbU/P
VRILVHWDDAAEAELISLYLNVDDHEGVVVTDSDVFLEQAASSEHHWDIILLTTSTPTNEAAYDLFNKIRHMLPDCPVVGACHAGDVYRIARYMTNGMRSYLIRDTAGDFIFLLRSTLESTREAVNSEREKMISERLREEIESVRKLQQSIIPDDLACCAGYEVSAQYESSQIRVMGGQPVVLAGGDYYDVFMLDDNTTVFILGDASGHGMKACMSIMTMHTLIRMIQRDQYRDTASFVEQINQNLCNQQIVNDDGGFITLLFGILRKNTNEFQWTSAGHPIPLLQNLETNEITMLGTVDDGGLPLGIVDSAEYEMTSSLIPPGSRLLLYTDGLEEAFPDGTADHAEFGRKGIEESLRNTRSEPLQNAMQALFDDSNRFTKGAGRHDDTSLLLIERDLT